MKQLLAIFFFLFLAFFINTVSAQSKTNVLKNDVLQTSATQVKQDSNQLRQEQVNIFMEQVLKATSVTEFQQWCYKKMTAEKYDEFTKIYQVFLQQKFDEWVGQKKK